jgi:hypothetical protein
MIPRVPQATKVTSRTCGNPPCPPPDGGAPNAAALAGEHGTSSMVPSSAASSRPNANAPGVPGPASGPASRVNSSRSGPGPARRRARASAPVPGRCQPPGPASGASHPASLRATSPYPSPPNNAQPSVNTTTATAGSSRCRLSRTPAAATASAIRSSGRVASAGNAVTR